MLWTDGRIDEPIDRPQEISAIIVYPTFRTSDQRADDQTNSYFVVIQNS